MHTTVLDDGRPARTLAPVVTASAVAYERRTTAFLDHALELKEPS